MCEDVCIYVTEIVENVTIEVRDFSISKILSNDVGNIAIVGSDGLVYVPQGGVSVTKTSELTNDGQDGVNPFITALDTANLVKKEFSQHFDFNGSGVNQIIPLNPSGYTEIRLQNPALVSIAGYNLSEITGNPSAEIPYNGKPYVIRNLTGNPVIVKNELIAADTGFFLTGGSDLIIPNKESLYVTYDASGFVEAWRSWSEGGGGSSEYMLSFAAGSRTWVLNTWYQRYSGDGFGITGAVAIYGTGATPSFSFQQNASWLQIPKGFIIDKVTFGVQGFSTTLANCKPEIYITRGEITEEQIGHGQTNVEVLCQEVVDFNPTGGVSKFLKDLTVASHVAKDFSILQVGIRETNTNNANYSVLLNITFKKS